MKISAIMMGMIVVLLAAPAWSQKCPETPPLNDQKIEGDIKGSVGGLIKMIGNAELSGRASVEKKEVLSRYPNASETLINMAFIAMFCQELASDTSMKTEQKVAEMRKFRASIVGIPIKD
ncbi:hypothetical protein [Azospirillum soli]|uniref:hypothetical protein n=1 Tax=Azospirillum soli TaxID=1304799 RepID=UPI001AE3FB7B|nr:hypothetical protein [Azospirillum soli]MBP2311702.1 hypothetical protein [Azospirillum soli]